jgi:hypothetical protein
MSVSPQQPYPSADKVMNRARAFVNDAFQGGAGRILTNAAPFTVEYLNSSLEELAQRIRNRGVITLEYDNWILTPITALPAPDPAVQIYVSFGGFFNGYSMVKTPVLPGNCLQVLEVWERQTGSGLPFQPMKPVRPLSSANQGPYLRNWEFRQDRINMRGSTVTEDLRIRFTGSLAQIAPATTENPWSDVTIQILASTNALAKIVAYNYALARGAAAADKMSADADKYTRLITNAYTRQNQRTPARRKQFGQRNIGGVNLPW